MRKIFNIFMILSLMISTFDIIDVEDLHLDGAPIFSNDNEHANNTGDDLEQEAINASGTIFFTQEFNFSLKAPIASKSTYFITLNQPKIQKLTTNLYRPPCI